VEPSQFAFYQSLRGDFNFALSEYPPRTFVQHYRFLFAAGNHLHLPLWVQRQATIQYDTAALTSL